MPIVRDSRQGNRRRALPIDPRAGKNGEGVKPILSEPFDGRSWARKPSANNRTGRAGGLQRVFKLLKKGRPICVVFVN